MFKRFACMMIAALMVIGLCACSTGDKNDSSGSNKGDSNQTGNNQSGPLSDGKWPAAVYSQYGIDEISTKGKIVYTELNIEGSYQYCVYYQGVTRDELVSWTNGLFEKGLRAADRDKERLENSTYFYDIMIYCEKERQPYRMRLSFDFEDGMDFEYYAYYDEQNPNYTVVEREDDYGETHAFVEYNLSISLNPLNNKEEYDGDFPSLGLKAEDLKGVENVRRIGMDEAAYMSAINFNFYADHITTEDELKQCRELLIDKLAEKGATFYELLNPDQKTTASELKEKGTGGFCVENNGTKFAVTVNPDSGYGDFGSGYGLILSKTNN